MKKQFLERISPLNIPKITVVIPAYNEKSTIGNTLAILSKFVQEHSWEVIVVDDASEDDTSGIVKEYPDIKCFSHPYNKGYGASLKTGIRRATHDFVVTMDADGQHDPKEIFKLIESIGEYDMVVGSRENQKNADWLRVPGKLILSWTANYLSGQQIPDINSGFRLIRKRCVDEFFHILPNSFSFSTTITLAMMKAAYNVKFVSVNVNKREGGKSNVKQVKHGFTTLLLIIRCISLFNPLKVYAPVAAIVSLFGVVFGVYGVLRYHSFPKTAVLAVLAGIIILFFGILADQVAAIRRSIH